MTISMYCLYVGFDIDINVLAQGIKSFLASQVWFQSVAVTFWWSAIILLEKGNIYLVEKMWWNHLDSTQH